MNSTKLTYAKNRLNELKKQHLATIRQECVLIPKLFSDEEKLKAIKAGAYTIKPVKNEESWRNSWANRILFNGEKLANCDVEKQNKLATIVEKKFTILMDELMLGDEEKALASIKEFADYKFN